jgi:hypothetical protein
MRGKGGTIKAITERVSPRVSRARRVISNARAIIRLVSGSNLELPKNCEMDMEICPATPAIGGLREAAPGGRLGGFLNGPRHPILRSIGRS